MARLKRSSWFFLHFLQIISVFVCVQCVQLTSGNYVEQYLESAEVCTVGSGSTFIGGLIGEYSKKKVRLANFPNNTVVIKLTRWQEMWKSFFNFRCQFSVVAPRKYGVMMSIQSMNLRHKGDSCRDFIKFKGDNDDWSSSVCGELLPKDKSKTPEGLIGQRFLASNKGEIDVLFHTGPETKFIEEGEKGISIEIVFTAFQDCSSPTTAKLLADDKVRQCSPSACISKALYCDNKINCGFDDGFGADEVDCDWESDRSNSELKKSMSIFVFAITAVTTLVIVIMCTLIVCCCMRKFQKPPRNANLNQNHSLDIEFHLDHTGLPTAPPLTLDRSLQRGDTKSEEDLPPRYDEIFGNGTEDTIQPVQKKK